MAFIVKDSGGDFKPCPGGQHQVVCVDVVDRGMVTGEYGTKHMVQLRWETADQDTERNPPGPYLIVRSYTASLHEKSKLRADLEAWRGRPFTAQELAGFDVETVIGANGLMQVIQRTGNNGKVFANVQAIMGLPRGMPKIEPSPTYVRVKDRPDPNGHEPTGSEYDAPPPDDDDIPF